MTDSLLVGASQLGRRSESDSEHRGVLRSGGGGHLDGEAGGVPGGDGGGS